jgi:hypothetical protein
MTEDDRMADATPTMSFETFWEWVTAHPNCILRAGTRDAVVFDDDDFHWHFTSDGQANLLVQVIRGKRLVGEILIPRQDIAFVQGVLGDQEGEVIFELVSGDESSQAALFFFVLTHGYEAQEDPDPRRVH